MTKLRVQHDVPCQTPDELTPAQRAAMIEFYDADAIAQHNAAVRQRAQEEGLGADDEDLLPLYHHTFARLECVVNGYALTHVPAQPCSLQVSEADEARLLAALGGPMTEWRAISRTGRAPITHAVASWLQV